MPPQSAASLTIQWAYISKTDNFVQIFFMGTSWVALSIKNSKTQASREMTRRKQYQFVFIVMGGIFSCQALECGRARYFPSLVALFAYCIELPRVISFYLKTAHTRLNLISTHALALFFLCCYVPGFGYSNFLM